MKIKSNTSGAYNTLRAEKEENKEARNI